RPGVTVHSINYRDKPAAAAGWLKRLGDPYAKIGADIDGRAGIEWGVYGVPETFVIDGAGIVRFKHAGALTPQIVEKQILPLLEGAK
ncbi:MAG: DsbE family thiol:disulfide interchange protein, partial [Alphaproteobacteria bacterium]